MSCTKVVVGESLHKYNSDCLYQGDFLELNSDWQYIRHARIFVMKDKVCLASLKDDGEGLVLDERHNNCFEISRSCVNIDLVKNSPYTVKMNVKHTEHESSVYQLCDGDSWPDFLKAVDLRNRRDSQELGVKTRVLPTVTFDDMDDYISDSESEVSSLSEDSSADDLGLPRCFTLCVRGQGLGAMSTWNVNNAMMMMNPSHVRRLTSDRDPRRASIELLGLPVDSSETLPRSNSYPQVNYSSKSERSRSLPGLTELDNVLVDEDLRYGNLKPKRGVPFPEGYDAVRLQRSKSGVKNHLSFSSTLQYRTEFGKQHATSKRDLILNEQIGRLIAQPSSVKFTYAAKIAQRRGEKTLVSICESETQENFDTVKANEQPKSRPYEVVDTTGGKFKLSFRKFWKRREKLNKLGSKPDSSSQHDSDPEQIVFFNKTAVDYKCHVTTMPSYAVSGDRRGGLGNDAMGRKEPVTLSSVTKQNKEPSSPAGLPVKEKSKMPANTQPTFTGKDTIRKKIVKRILSPITILRSVSEEEKNVVDLTQTENESSAYQTKSSESLSQRRPKKLLDMNPYHLAQELTLIDKELLIRIPWNELSTCGWMTKDKYLRSPSVMSMVEFFNRIALVVASEILFEVDPIMRVRVISKVIQVANKLRSIGNFNSLKALLGGLQCTPIYRLKETWKEVSSKRKKNFRDLSKLMSEEDNFAAYRQELDSLMSQRSPCLPFLGDFLTQIAQTQTYLACRKKKTPDPPKEVTSSTESDASPSTPRPRRASGKQSPSRENRHRTSLARRRTAPVRENEARFSKSSPNLPVSCTRTVDRMTHRVNRFRRCRSWQYSNDSGIQVNNSNNSSLSASSNSFLTSNTSLGSESFVSHAKPGVNDERFLNSSFSKHRDLGRSKSTSTPLPVKNSIKARLRRHRSVSEKCLSVSESTSNVRTRMSFMRSFRRSKSMGQAPSSESIQRLYSTRLENGGTPGKATETKETCKKTISEHDYSTESGTELQLWHFHMAAIQYNFSSRAYIKEFLLSTSFNTEEDNYKLSLQREPPTRNRATTVS